MSYLKLGFLSVLSTFILFGMPVVSADKAETPIFQDSSSKQVDVNRDSSNTMMDRSQNRSVIDSTSQPTTDQNRSLMDRNRNQSNTDQINKFAVYDSQSQTPYGSASDRSSDVNKVSRDNTASKETTIKIVNDPKHGKILTDNKGMTLYTFTNDKGKESACTDQCAKMWPPLVVNSGEQPALEAGQSGNLGVIERGDKSRQVTFNGKPLYHFSGDSKPGDTNGQGFKNLWFIVSPTAAPISK